MYIHGITEDAHERLSPDSFHWKDLLTGTEYFIEKRLYHDIEEAGLKYLADVHDPDALFEYFNTAGQDVPGEAGHYARLPYIWNDQASGFRICDHMVVRTAYLYVLHHEDVSCERMTLPQIRMAGLMPEKAMEPPRMESVSRVNAMLMGESSAEDFQLDLVKGGLVKVKQYYLETNKIKNIRGASLLLDSINYDRIPNLIRHLGHPPECLIYSGGGKILAVLPPETGDEFRRETEALAESVSITAQHNFACMPNVSAIRFASDYKALMADLDRTLEMRQGLRWDWRTSPAHGVISLHATETIHVPESQVAPITGEDDQLCDHCRLRVATHFYAEAGGKTALCLSCLHKTFYGDAKAKEKARRAYLQHAEKNNCHPKEVPCYTLEDIVDVSASSERNEGGFLGVIYGDANNMSAAIQQIHTPCEMRYFSKETEDAVTDVVFRALQTHLPDTRFEIIALGGDDIFILVPGEKAYRIALTIGELFDERFRNRSRREASVTMSLGVCVTHYNMPIQYSFDFAQQLLHLAKKKAWAQRLNGNHTGTMDWVVIENESAVSSPIEAARVRMRSQPVAHTLRPYTFGEARAMAGFIENIHDHKARAYEFRQTLFRMDYRAANLFFEYQLLRNRSAGIDAESAAGATVIKPSLETLADAFGFKREVMNLHDSDKEKGVSPWLDAVELWEYIKGEGG